MTLIISALFILMEIAFVSSSKLRIEMDKAEKGLGSKALSIFYTHPNNFISTLLLGNNIALVIYGILMARIIDLYLLTPLGLQLSPYAVLAIQTLLSTIIVLITGEYLPKTLFRINPNGMMRALALPTFVFYIILYPISKFTSTLSKLLLRIAGAKVTGRAEVHPFKKADLDYLIQSNIDDVKDDNEISEEVRFFQNALDFSSLKVRDCIVPRTEVDAVPMETPLEELCNRFIESGHSKIIVYRHDIDDIVGYVHSSELFRLTPKSDWTKRIRQAPIVPETMAAQKLMQHFMQHKRSLAVVVDEFGGTSGIVTLEDLVEEIFGEIEDEHDKDNHIARRLAEGEYLLSGRLEIEKINELFDLDLPESEEYMTLSGLILHQCQRFPKLHETIKFDHWEAKIIQSTTTKIQLVRLKCLP